MDWKRTVAGWCQSRQLMWETPPQMTLTIIYRNVFFNNANKKCTYDLLLQAQKKSPLNCFAQPEWQHVCPNVALDQSFLFHHRKSTSHTTSSPLVLWIMCSIVSEKRIKGTCNYINFVLCLSCCIIIIIIIINSNREICLYSYNHCN